MDIQISVEVPQKVVLIQVNPLGLASYSVTSRARVSRTVPTGTSSRDTKLSPQRRSLEEPGAFSPPDQKWIENY
ncbi:hypothetical protein FOMG_11487 [Fusarium oxysporum f. sp. melonis 26406]|uniref:Uncharacterized protein n=1 Tax=Fusarium oxysporum f. sp. melonis 26406 TaxID=1089452 RepID=W9ZVM1_FUSOX|nr:hypothetical protein FOMG_11487 [Fusarium oxysporum f. sp. melonis 26406]